MNGHARELASCDGTKTLSRMLVEPVKFPLVGEIIDAGEGFYFLYYGPRNRIDAPRCDIPVVVYRGTSRFSPAKNVLLAAMVPSLLKIDVDITNLRSLI